MNDRLNVSSAPNATLVEFLAFNQSLLRILLHKPAHATVSNSHKSYAKMIKCFGDSLFVSFTLQ